jgi:RNA polymerase sigma-70 factor (ECF subfamily)
MNKASAAIGPRALLSSSEAQAGAACEAGGDDQAPAHSQERPATKPATLGDVLYANPSGELVSERSWADLVQRIATGDQLALHALYDRSHRMVFTLIMRITRKRETAEELTLDVFLEVWRRAPRYDPANGTVLGWVMNLARSRAIDRLRFDQRQKRVDPHHGGADEELESNDGQRVLELKERARILRAALSVLTPDERQAIETAFFLELTYAEVAIRLSQPLGTVKTRIRSGLHKLRRALAAEMR